LISFNATGQVRVAQAKPVSSHFEAQHGHARTLAMRPTGSRRCPAFDRRHARNHLQYRAVL